MDHTYYRDKISAYFDGALEAQERELIRRHIEECADCRSLLERLNSFDRVINEKSGLSGDEYFESLAQKIESRISLPRERVVDVRSLRWRSFGWKISAAAASILLVATFAYYQLEDDGDLRLKILEEESKKKSIGSVTVDSAVSEETLESGRMERLNEGLDSVKEIGALEGDKVGKRKVATTKPLEQAKDDRQSDVAGETAGSFEENAPSASAAPGAAVESEKKSEEETSALTDGLVLAEKPATVRFDSVDEMGQQSAGTQNTLTEWRSQRDSFQVVLGFEDDTVQNMAQNKLKRFAAPSLSGLVKSNDTVRVYQQLANSWYQIGLQTTDSTEKNRAVQFLNWYKSKFPADSLLVNQQLQQLPK
jgi:hypothetical protein